MVRFKYYYCKFHPSEYLKGILTISEEDAQRKKSEKHLLKMFKIFILRAVVLLILGGLAGIVTNNHPVLTLLDDIFGNNLISVYLFGIPFLVVLAALFLAPIIAKVHRLCKITEN